MCLTSNSVVINTLFNCYYHCRTSWELPELVSGSYRMVSDADGKHYPWYGAKNEVMQVCGPTQLSTPITVSMHDTVHPQVGSDVLCKVMLQLQLC